jgi:Domain of unknown function (DUF4440)
VKLRVLTAALLFSVLAGVMLSARAGNVSTRKAGRDGEQIALLENEWLHAQDPAVLERILAPDFVHPVAAGNFLSKQEQIDWFTKHRPPAGEKKDFERMQLRFYGDIAIVNGIVAAQTSEGVRRTVFTDVFIHRNGQWQAVNAQENLVEAHK